MYISDPFILPHQLKMIYTLFINQIWRQARGQSVELEMFVVHSFFDLSFVCTAIPR